MRSGIRPTTPPNPDQVARRFGLGEVVGEPRLAARGELGRIWRMETATRTWAVKEVFATWTEEAAAAALADLAFQQLACAGGIPMPRPMPAVGGEALVDVGEPGDWRAVRVYEWVDLRGRDAVAPVAEVASILGRLHAIAPADHRPIDPWFAIPPDPALWPGLLDRARDARVPWLASFEALLPVVAATAGAGWAESAELPLVTCHLDFNPENVLVDVTGRVVVVDWENSAAATTDQELASALAEFTRTPAARDDFLLAYVAAGGTGRLRDATAFGLTFIVQANLVATYANRALDETADAEDRRRAAGWVVDIAENAFTPGHVEGWLAAARRTGAG